MQELVLHASKFFLEKIGKHFNVSPSILNVLSEVYIFFACVWEHDATDMTSIFKRQTQSRSLIEEARRPILNCKVPFISKQCLQ
jgi:hypothetical protein